ncbi:hypothetical protein [Arthrobacter sp. M4]|uniref:hypothetical protein n=1 Tax=Arthrobacter sp. M4 TaxID=218160 RepID=UPI001CDCD66A|nr:hypothetical protein [Arthrobacter sp. M4]MCA4131878.1 hypothetical protein [Arthrobacter sp. M4]
MNGITGRMGYRQHLLRSILPIRDAGGFTLEASNSRTRRAAAGSLAGGVPHGRVPAVNGVGA